MWSIRGVLGYIRCIILINDFYFYHFRFSIRVREWRNEKCMRCENLSAEWIPVMFVKQCFKCFKCKHFSAEVSSHLTAKLRKLTPSQKPEEALRGQKYFNSNFSFSNSVLMSPPNSPSHEEVPSYKKSSPWQSEGRTLRPRDDEMRCLRCGRRTLQLLIIGLTIRLGRGWWIGKTKPGI